MKAKIFLSVIILFVTVSLFAQQPDSTLIKKYNADLKMLRTQVERIEKDYNEFLGKHFRTLQEIQSQMNLLLFYIEEQKKILSKKN